MEASSKYSILNSYVYNCSYWIKYANLISLPLREILGGKTINLQKNESSGFKSPASRFFIPYAFVSLAAPIFNHLTGRKIDRYSPVLGTLLRIVPYPTLFFALSGFIGLLLKYGLSERETIIKINSDNSKRVQNQIQLHKITLPATQWPSVMPKDLSEEEIKKVVFGEHTLEDIPEKFDVSKFVTYRGLSDENRQLVRKNIYETLIHLVTDEVELPFVDFEGEVFTVSKNEGILVFKTKSGFLDWEIVISKDGQSTFTCEYLHIENEGTEYTMLGEYEVRVDEPGLDGEWVFEKRKTTQQCPIERYFHIAPSFVELLTFKLVEMTDFLEGKKQNQAIRVFDQCLLLLKNIKNDVSSEKQAIASNIEIETFSIGPMVNPTIASEDSTFTWQITRDNKEGTLSLELQKEASGRAFHAGSTRTLKLSQDATNPEELTVTIVKTDDDDLSQSKSISSYKLKIGEEGGGLQILPEGKDADSTVWLPFVILGEDHSSTRVPSHHSNNIQDLPTIKEEIDFAMKVLTTVSDLSSNPHTVVLRKDAKDNFLGYYTLDNEQIPASYINRRLEFSQGLVTGAPALVVDRGLTPYPKTYHGRTNPVGVIDLLGYKFRREVMFQPRKIIGT